jgi:hypothetical protein
MVLDPNNPLSAMGRSNDPSLEKRTTDSAAASDALRRDLAQLTSQGQNADRLANINNTALSEAARKLPYQRSNIRVNDPEANTKLDARRLNDIATNNAAQFANRSAGMVGLGKVGKFGVPEPKQTALKAVRPNIPIVAGPPIGDSAAAAGLPILQTGNKSEKGDEYFEVIDGRAHKRTGKETVTVDTKEKGAISPEVQSLIDKAVAHFGKKGNFEVRQMPDGTWAVFADVGNGLEQMKED